MGLSPYPFKGHYLLPLDYNDLISILADNGMEYLNEDPKLGYDVWINKAKSEVEDVKNR